MSARNGVPQPFPAPPNLTTGGALAASNGESINDGFSMVLCPLTKNKTYYVTAPLRFTTIEPEMLLRQKTRSP